MQIYCIKSCGKPKRGGVSLSGFAGDLRVMKCLNLFFGIFLNIRETKLKKTCTAIPVLN
jgi:hypothetical protein